MWITVSNFLLKLLGVSIVCKLIEYKWVLCYLICRYPGHLPNWKELLFNMSEHFAIGSSKVTLDNVELIFQINFDKYHKHDHSDLSLV